MPKYKAKRDGYLSAEAIFVKEGQVIDFPEGREPIIDLSNPENWLVPFDGSAEIVVEPVLPVVGALPVVSEDKPKAHELEIVRPEYDSQMATIIEAENVADGVTAADTTTTQAEEQQGTGNQDVLG